MDRSLSTIVLDRVRGRVLVRPISGMGRWIISTRCAKNASRSVHTSSRIVRWSRLTDTRHKRIDVEQHVHNTLSPRRDTIHVAWSLSGVARLTFKLSADKLLAFSLFCTCRS
jgi:hypothetical protein